MDAPERELAIPFWESILELVENGRGDPSMIKWPKMPWPDPKLYQVFKEYFDGCFVREINISHRVMA